MKPANTRGPAAPAFSGPQFPCRVQSRHLRNFWVKLLSSHTESCLGERPGCSSCLEWFPSVIPTHTPLCLLLPGALGEVPGPRAGQEGSSFQARTNLTAPSGTSECSLSCSLWLRGNLQVWFVASTASCKWGVTVIVQRAAPSPDRSSRSVSSSRPGLFTVCYAQIAAQETEGLHAFAQLPMRVNRKPI